MVLSYKLYSCRLACIPDEKCMQGPSILSYQVIRARKGLFKLPEVIVLSNDTHNLQYSTVHCDGAHLSSKPFGILSSKVCWASGAQYTVRPYEFL